MSETSIKSWLPLWVILSVTWGFSFVFIKVAGEFLVPFQQSFARLALGAIALSLLVIVSRRKFITEFAHVKHLAFLGLVGQAIPFTLFAWAGNLITSIAAGLMNSMMALWTALFAVVFLPEEKLNSTRLVGLLTGFVGVLILLGVWDGNFRGTWAAYVGLMFATICYAVSALYLRKKVSPLKLDPIAATATQLLVALIPLGLLVGLSTKMPTEFPTSGLVSIFMLGVFGTGVALALNFELIARAGAITSSTVTYSIPIVATIAGVVLLREKLHWYEPIGAATALLGIAIIQGLIKFQRIDR